MRSMSVTNYKSRIKWITQSAVFIAVLMVAQAFTAQLGNRIITGSLVNLVLIISVMTCGLSVGISVSVVSPVLANLFGIGSGSFWTIIPFIIIGNVTLVFIWHYIGCVKRFNRKASYISSMVLAAVAKFAVLYIGIVRIAVPFMMNLPDTQTAIISNAFSLPQLFTAALGGTTAAVILPLLERAVPNRV